MKRDGVAWASQCRSARTDAGTLPSLSFCSEQSPMLGDRALCVSPPTPYLHLLSRPII